MGIEDDWRRVVEWLEVNKPDISSQIDPPCPGEHSREIAARYPTEWPPDLKRFYELQNGSSNSLEPPTQVVPWFRVLAVDEAWDEYRMRHPEPGSDLLDPEFANSAAGDPAGGFLPAFVPLAMDVATGLLCVDLRTGPLRGCIIEVDEDGSSAPIWHGLSQMVKEIADGLWFGQSVRGYSPVTSSAGPIWADAADMTRLPRQPDITPASAELQRLHTRQLDAHRLRHHEDDVWIHGNNWSGIESGLLEVLRSFLAGDYYERMDYMFRIDVELLPDLDHAFEHMNPADRDHFAGLRELLTVLRRMRDSDDWPIT